MRIHLKQTDLKLFQRVCYRNIICMMYQLLWHRQSTLKCNSLNNQFLCKWILWKIQIWHSWMDCPLLHDIWDFNVKDSLVGDDFLAESCNGLKAHLVTLVAFRMEYLEGLFCWLQHIHADLPPVLANSHQGNLTVAGVLIWQQKRQT